jgi:hypothetical protein
MGVTGRRLGGEYDGTELDHGRRLHTKAIPVDRIESNPYG